MCIYIYVCIYYFLQCQEDGAGVVKIRGLAVRDGSGKLRRAKSSAVPQTKEQAFPQLIKQNVLKHLLRCRTSLLNKSKLLPNAAKLATWMSRTFPNYLHMFSSQPCISVYILQFCGFSVSGEEMPLCGCRPAHEGVRPSWFLPCQYTASVICYADVPASVLAKYHEASGNHAKKQGCQSLERSFRCSQVGNIQVGNTI